MLLVFHAAREAGIKMLGDLCVGTTAGCAEAGRGKRGWGVLPLAA